MLQVGAWLAAIALTIAGCQAIPSSKTPNATVLRTVRIGGSFERLSPAELAAQAEIVLIAQPTGERVEHWNNANNTAWGDTGDGAYVYRDEVLAVDQVLVGEYGARTLTLRTVGGTSDQVELLFDGQPDLKTGTSYLLFVKDQETPFQDGTEIAWVPVGMEQGVFMRNGTEWLSNADVVISQADSRHCICMPWRHRGSAPPSLPQQFDSACHS